MRWILRLHPTGANLTEEKRARTKQAAMESAQVWCSRERGRRAEIVRAADVATVMVYWRDDDGLQYLEY